MENPSHNPEGAIAPNLPALPERDYSLDLVHSFDILKNVHGIYPHSPEEYASVPLKEAFDWNYVDEVVAKTFGPRTKKFVFAFYSKPNPAANRDGLNEADLLAFFEARDAKPDDFCHYFRGEPDSHGNVLSFCIWTTPEEAASVTSGKYHQQAAKLAKASYLEVRAEGHMLERAGEGSDNVNLEMVFEHSLNVGVSESV